MEEDIKVFMPTSKFVMLAGKKYEVKKLGIKQIFNFMLFIGSLQEDLRKNISENLEGDNKKDFINFISKLSAEQLPKLFGIFLNSDDIEEMKKIDDAIEVSELLLSILETNDIERLIANFSKTAEKIMQAWKKISSVSQPSLSK